MPHKGFFTQGLSVLLAKPVGLDAIAAALSDFQIAKRTGGDDNWPFGGPSLIVSFRPEANGYVAVESFERRWPDGMGDPKTDSALFGAWSMGHFGPCAFPGNLERAGQHSYVWQAAGHVSQRHTAFIRILSSYVFGAHKNAPVLPPAYDPLAELAFITELALALLALPEALCYFNPNGEVLQERQFIRKVLARFRGGGTAPLEVWSNVRLFQLQESPRWLLMDTVGMGQLDVPDHEACFSANAYQPSEVVGFLRNMALYVLENGEIIENGDTADGPGDIRWQGAAFDAGVAAPPRRVLRWFPMDGSHRPPGLQGEQ